MARTFKPTISVDFDGVIHSYERGWQDGRIYGSVVPGFFDWLVRVSDRAIVVVFSSRSKSPETLADMESWLNDRHGEWLASLENRRDRDRGFEAYLRLTFAADKPAALVTIDDRAICFNGKWDDPAFSIESILAFKPWYQAA